MSNKFIIRCVDCGAIAGPSYATACVHCGGLIDVSYSFDKVRIYDSDNPYRRYFDLLPVNNFELMPEGQMTPLVHARNLGKRIGLTELYLKNETINPTGTTKDRMAAVALSYLYEAGVNHFCTSSTGNSSTAYAQAIQNIPDMKMELFTAEDFHHRVHYKSTQQVCHHVLRNANFVDAGEYSTAYARRHGLTAEGGFFNLGRREGLKLPWLEIVEQLPGQIDWYVQAVSSAMGVYGVYKAAHEAVMLGLTARKPKLLCAQQASCAPMVRAWHDGAEKILPHHIVPHPSGIAEAILRGNPTRVYAYIRNIVQESGGTMLAASEDEICAAQRYVKEDEGINICPAAATAVASIISLSKIRNDLGDQRIVVNLTGKIREQADTAPIDSWIERDNWRLNGH